MFVKLQHAAPSSAHSGVQRLSNAFILFMDCFSDRCSGRHRRWMVPGRGPTISRELEQAEKEMEGGRYSLARQRFLELRQRRPQSDEAAYQLGICEEKLGRLDAALTAWSGVPADSPFFIKASIGSALTLMNLGRYSQAERVLMSIPRHTGPYAAHVRQQIELVLRIEGRTQEARDIILEAWPEASDPSDVLKRLYELEVTPIPVDYVRAALKQGDPNDDRVWLGLGNLALWTGQLEESARWLDACVRKRPDDQPVWLARLRWRWRQQTSRLRLAANQVNAAWFLPTEVLRIRASIVARKATIVKNARFCWLLLPRNQGMQRPGRGLPSSPAARAGVLMSTRTASGKPRRVPGVSATTI